MGSNILLVCLSLSVLILPILGKPVNVGSPSPQEAGATPMGRKKRFTGLEYDQYLRQVVEVLESDPSFRKKLETANVSDIKNGNVAMYLEMVGHNVRTALDELKRQEVARLQELTHLKMQGTSGIDLIKNAMFRANGRAGIRHFEIPSHLDFKNPHSFEMSDLKNLILKTTADLEELDKKKNEEFKEYEMEKEYEKKQHLNQLSEEERKKEEDRLEQLKKKHANHPKLNHPGSKDQLEEVWDKVDHLEDQDFNPKTFFYTHDLNGDFEWSIEEVEALLQLELDKVYDARNSPDEDDPLEREQDMSRMRKHIFTEMDLNKDYRITIQEFLNYTGTQGDRAEFNQDDGWKTVDENPVFSEEEYQEFIKSHHDQPSKDLKFVPEHIQGQQQPPLNQHQEQQQPHLNQHQGEQQPHLNQHQGEQQPHLNQHQGEQQPHLNQHQEQQQPQANQHQEHQQPQANQHQEHQQPQANQHQEHQQPQANQHQEHQQPQANQHQEHQQPHANQEQKLQDLQDNLIQPKH